MIRFLYHWIAIKIFGYTVYGSGILFKAINEIDKEYYGNKSWYNGKIEAIKTLIICIICLILISCIINY